MAMSEDVICSRCHFMRSANRREPCRRCGARQTIFGYRLPHEIKGYTILLASILLVLILAGLAAIMFWFKLQSDLHQVNIVPLNNFVDSLSFLWQKGVL